MLNTFVNTMVLTAVLTHERLSRYSDGAFYVAIPQGFVEGARPTQGADMVRPPLERVAPGWDAGRQRSPRRCAGERGSGSLKELGDLARPHWQ